MKSNIKNMYALKALFFIIILLCSTLSSKAQEKDSIRLEIISVIDSFFSAMHRGDSASISQIMHPTVVIKTISPKKISITPLSTFLMAISKKPRPNEWFEKIQTYEIGFDDNLAWASTEYTFFLDANLSHCGYNHFVLAKENNGDWKIHMIIDTRRVSDCLNEEERIEIEKKKITDLMNHWHDAAATADEDIFFDSLMTKDAIYLGTDITERWLRDELKTWAKKAFEKDVAWAFRAKRRSIYIDENNPNFAWLEEDLDTWMGPCRGSAVLNKINGKWKIRHYNLAVAIANEAIDQYLKIIGIKKKK